MSIASRVVPGTSETIARSSFKSAFSSDDLPTLGWPISASASCGSSSLEGSSGGNFSTIASSKSPVPSPWIAETGTGSPKPRPPNSACIEASARGDSILFATSTTGLRVRRRISATSWSTPTKPSSASTTNTITSASRAAMSAWARVPEAIASVGSTSVSMPPVSTRVKVRPFHSARA